MHLRSRLVLALVVMTAAATSPPIWAPPIGMVLAAPSAALPPPPGAGDREDCGAATGIIDTAAGGGPRDANAIYLPVGVAVGPDGSLYIADARSHRVRKVRPDGTMANVAGTGEPGYSGDGGPAAEAAVDYPTGVALRPDGSLYIADRHNHRIRKVDPEGVITTVAGSGARGYAGDGGPATNAKLNSPYRIAVAANGDLYIADTYNRMIRKVDGAGIITTVAGGGPHVRAGRAVRSERADDLGDGGPATEARLRDPYGVAVGPDGSIYIADTNHYRVRKVDPAGIITTVAGTGQARYSGDGGRAVEAETNRPRDVAVGEDGSVYIADTWDARIRKVDPAGIITTVAGNGKAGYSGDEGPATEASLLAPQSMAPAADGSLYIADGGNHRVRRVDPAGIISTAAGGRLGEDAPSTEVALYGPCGVAVAPDGVLYIAESGCDRVRRLDRTGVVSTVAGNGMRASSEDGGRAAEASLNIPISVAVGPDGSVYVAEYGGHRVRRVDPAGTISTIAGSGEAGYGGDGGPAVEARLQSPGGVAAAADGSIYIADTENHRIRKVGADGIITTVAGNGTADYGGDVPSGVANGPVPPATLASLNRPRGIAVGPDGAVYIADSGNSRIRKLDPAGFITAVGSDLVDPRFGLRAPDAGLNVPVAVAIARDGSLYVADTGNHRVRKIDAAGIMATVAGDGIWGYRGDGGPATTAGLWYPSGVAVGADGALYIADDCNDRVRRVRWRPCDPEAAKAMADALRVDAGVSVDTWREVAELYLIAKAWDDALDAAQRLLALTPEADEPGRLHAEILIARACVGNGDDDEARRRLIRVLGRAGDPMVLRDAADLLVDIYLRQGQRDQAIATLNDLRLRTHDRQLLEWIDQRLKQIAGEE